MKYVLGIDTSNYTTSIAIINQEFEIVCDKRKAIEVKQGMKGIRQSEALFQHMNNLPELLESILSEYAYDIKGVCVSSRPRPVRGSYMPVFKAGYNAGKLISDSLKVPFYETSHQEGHIKAGLYPELIISASDSALDESLAVFHVSGGTTEILVNNEIIGGSKDISFGQLIDRMGVNFGFPFPAGASIDKIVCDQFKKIDSYDCLKQDTLKRFKYISKDCLYINLSGLDSQITRLSDSPSDSQDNIENHIFLYVFYLISQCLKSLTTDVKKQYNIKSVLFVGGVSSSKFIRDFLRKESENETVKLYFARPELSVDNAVGVALIGGKMLWR